MNKYKILKEIRDREVRFPDEVDHLPVRGAEAQAAISARMLYKLEIPYFPSKARFPYSRPCRLNRLCRFKFLEATGTIIWKRSSDHSGRSLRQKRPVVRDRLEFYPWDRNDDHQAIAYF